MRSKLHILEVSVILLPFVLSRMSSSQSSGIRVRILQRKELFIRARHRRERDLFRGRPTV